MRWVTILWWLASKKAPTADIFSGEWDFFSDQLSADYVRPASQGPSQVPVDKCDVVGNILPGMNLAIASLFKGQYDVSQATLLSDARVEESHALVDSSGCTPNCGGFSPQVKPTLPSLRRLGAGSSGFTPCLSAPKRASSWKLVPFLNLIALLPSELVLLNEVANHSVFSLSEKPRRGPCHRWALLEPLTLWRSRMLLLSHGLTPYKIPKKKAMAPQPPNPTPTPHPTLSCGVRLFFRWRHRL